MFLNASGCPDAELSVVWTDDAGIRPLNRRWLGRDRATDVLSFPMGEGEAFANTAGDLLGDVVVSLETALRIARRRRASPDRIVAHLLAHGLLHLLGHDHVASARQRVMMRAAERALLRRAAREIPGLRVRAAAHSARVSSTRSARSRRTISRGPAPS